MEFRFKVIVGKTAIYLASIAIVTGCSTSKTNDVAALDCNKQYTNCAAALPEYSGNIATAETLSNSEESVDELVDSLPLVNPILFGFSESSTTDINLSSIADYLLNHLDAQVALHGYTDPIGSKSFNLNLSKQRASFVKARLMSYGVDPSRITVYAHGEENLKVAAPSSSQQMSLASLKEIYQPNRRVTLEFIQ